MTRRVLVFSFILVITGLLGSESTASEGTEELISYSLEALVQNIVAGDFNRDGALDLVVSQGPRKTISILLGDGQGRFSPPREYEVIHSLTGFLLNDDFNRDGILDLIVFTGGDGIALLLGDGNGGFGPGKIVALIEVPQAGVAGDFNHDGKPDLAIVNDLAINPSVALLLGDGTGGFSEPTHFTFMSEKPKGTQKDEYGAPRHMVAADFNKDGNLDLALTLQYNDNVALLFGDGKGNLSSPKELKLSPESEPRGITVGDFNMDGKPDLAVGTTANGYDIWIFLGDGKGGFTFHQKMKGQLSHWSLATADFNGDGKPDLVVRDFDGKVSIFFGHGDGTFFTSAVFPVVGKQSDYYANSIALGDFNNDGHIDLATVSEDPSTVSVLLNPMGQQRTGVMPSMEFYRRKMPIQASHMLINLRNPKILYLATANQGVFRSADRGKSWFPINKGIKNYVVFAMVMDPSNPSVLYVGTWGGGIYKTENGGESWHEVNEGLTTVSINALAIDPADPNILYASTSLGAFQSKDAGNSWSLMGGASSVHLSDNPNYMRSLLATPSSSTLLLGSDLGLLRWAEQGSRWETVDSLPLNRKEIRSLAYDQRNKTVYVGTDEGLYISQDEGKTWSLLSREIRAGSIVFSPVQPDTTYILDYHRGILRSSDGGHSWIQLNEGLRGELRAFAVDPVRPTHLYAGTYNDGAFYSVNGGKNWKPVKHVALQSIEETLFSLLASEGEKSPVPFPPPEFTKCNQCHSWTDPNLRFYRKSWWQMTPTRRDWSLTVFRMGPRAGLTFEEMANILKHMNAYYGLEKDQ